MRQQDPQVVVYQFHKHILYCCDLDVLSFECPVNNSAKGQ